MTDGLAIAAATSLTPAESTAITDLVSAATAADGFSALNEAALLHLRHPRDTVVHLLARHGGALVGYAQLEPDADGAGSPASTGQLVVDPTHRRAGVGEALLKQLLDLAPSPLRLWAMSDTPAARALASGQGLVAARELLIMTRSLVDPVPQPPVPDDVGLRTFVVGQDEDEWLAVNASAFRDHPEQGQLTRGDLDDRMTEQWFDPQGFFLAVQTHGESPGRMVGFHWTKQHSALLGEVYVLGVDPRHGGHGLGRSLLGRGLSHLRDRGNRTVELYVEGDSRAVGLYTGYGFTVASRDVMYAQP